MPLSHAVIVFGVVMGLYWLFNYLTEISPKFSDWMEGKDVLLLHQGRLHWANFHAQNLTHKELFGELRQQQVEHLGQLKAVYSEATGEPELVFLRRRRRAARPVHPPQELARASETIATAGLHACVNCGHVLDAQPAPALACPTCREGHWLPACTARRVT
ncbi:YetF domain-containing protein [Hymenobacter humi]|uniref:YetF domain-containing protein n=1 Tax=Hymenobacter humi TaxID=1411620 RepID=A0ABW2U6U7_9BACT